MSMPLDFDYSNPIDELTNTPFLVKKTPGLARVNVDPNSEAVQNAIAVIKSTIVSDVCQGAVYAFWLANRLEAVTQLDRQKWSIEPLAKFHVSDKFWNAVSVCFSKGLKLQEDELPSLVS